MMMMVVVMVVLVMMMMIRLAGLQLLLLLLIVLLLLLLLLLKRLLLYARARTADVAAVTGVAALAAFNRALSGHPHKCGRAARAGVRRENPRRKGEKEENDGDVSETRDRDTPTLMAH